MSAAAHVRAPPPDGPRADAPDRQASAGPERVSILLVDDVEENLIALRAMLASPGYRFATATSGEAALAALLREEFALVLLDVVMPGMDGFEVANHMKQLERTKHVPILFLSAQATEVSQIYAAYSVGAVDYLIKPLDARTVRAKVAVFADLYRQRQEIARQAALLREADRRAHELRVAEVRLASDERYRKLVEGIAHTVAWSMTPDTLRPTFVSGQVPRVLGYSVEQFVQPGFWHERVPPEDRRVVLDAFERAVREGADVSCTHRILAADGRPLWFRTGVSVVRDAGGTPELHGVSTDVTPMKHAEEEALAATRARDSMLAVVSHDLRSPLSSIGLAVERLRRGPLDERVARSVDVIARAAERMKRLVDDLVDIEQIELKRLRVERCRQKICALFTEALELLEPIAREKGVSLSFTPGTAVDADVLCDRGRILQVIANVVGNAIKFSPANREVKITGQRVAECVRFDVTDEGPGVPADQLPHLFERYWQGAGPRAAGLGLGLAIAKGIIEAHDGTIGVESEVGAGSCFFFVLPVADAREAPDGARVTSRADGPARRCTCR